MLNKRRTSIGKRLLAIFYDFLILFFLTFVITLIIQQFVIQLGLIEFEQVQITAEGETVSIIPSDSFLSLFLKNTWLIISFLYFTLYWSRRGKTLGMKVWKIKVVDLQGKSISWNQAMIRYISSIFGLGLFAIPFNKNKAALQDILSKSQLIVDE